MAGDTKLSQSTKGWDLWSISEAQKVTVLKPWVLQQRKSFTKFDYTTSVVDKKNLFYLRISVSTTVLFLPGLHLHVKICVSVKNIMSSFNLKSFSVLQNKSQSKFHLELRRTRHLFPSAKNSSPLILFIFFLLRRPPVLFQDIQ